MTVRSQLDASAPATRALGYWRDCLADEAAASGERFVVLAELELGAAALGVVAKLASDSFATGAAGPVPVRVAVGRLSSKRRAAEGADGIVPLWIPAALTRTGALVPEPERRPFLARALLEPTGGPLSIGALDDAAEFCARNPVAFDSWSEQWAWAMALWEAVAKTPLAEYVPSGWRFVPDVRVVEPEPVQAAGTELALLDAARSRLAAGAALPLLERFAAGGARAEGSSMQRGHAADVPLSDDLRGAVERALALREGDALAVASPPGTGAVELVGSLVASLVVNAVVHAAGPFDAKPPLIALAMPAGEAAAAWLDAFCRDDDPTPSGKRWIAPTGGSAIQLAAGERRDSAADRGYPTLHGSAAAWESSSTAPLSNRAELERAYLEAFAQAYGRVAPSLDDAVAYLFDATREWTARLPADAKAGDSALGPTSAGVDRAAIRARLAAPHDAAVAAAEAELEEIDAARAQEAQGAPDLQRRLDDAVAALRPRGWYEAAFPWIGTVAERRRERLAAALGAAPPAGRKSPEALRDWVEEHKAAERARASRALTDRDAAVERLERARAERAAALDAFDHTAKTWDALGDVTASHGFDAARLSETAEAPEERFDRVHRREAFRCAARYWEGRRLRELTEPEAASALNDAPGPGPRALRSVAMLYPLAVATLPALAAFYAPADGDGTRLDALDALDVLLVVDAEQVDVARGAAALSLAKRAVALGDPFGREPLVQLDEARSRGHLGERFGDAAASDEFARRSLLMYDRGRGSLLHALPDRVALTSQRDRVPEIVACCDELAYRGLRALRETPARGGWPALGYAQVRGGPEQRGAGRVNEAEARNLVQFVIERREQLLRAYPGAKCLADVIAILSPFSAQAAFIGERLADALRACRMRAEPELAIGTPFGRRAPVPIVLYSHVLGPGDESALVDARPNLLALALWSATDHFLFFGDVAALTRRPRTSPSRVLGDHLLARPANRLDGLPVSYYGSDVELASVDLAARHAELFEEALQLAKQRLLIVSPLGPSELDERALQQLDELAQRGVRITVITGRATAEAPPAAVLRARGVEWNVREPLLASALAFDREALYEGFFSWLARDGTRSAPGGSGWLARGPGVAGAVDELQRYYASL